MRAPALGEAVTHLPWLSPSAASLTALARAPAAAAWNELRFDPGAVLLLLRHGVIRAGPVPTDLPSLIYDPAVLENAVRHLDRAGAGFVDWSALPARRVYHGAIWYARAAREIALRTCRANADHAWAAGLLSPLGWLAVCALEPAAAAAVLESRGTEVRSENEPISGPDLNVIQLRVWGQDHASICRRLGRRWALPRWLSTLLGHLDLPVETALALGADGDLYQIVQLAVGVVQRHEVDGLGLTISTTPETAATALGFASAELEELEREIAGWKESPLPSISCEPPTGLPLLRDLLAATAENRRLSEAPIIHNLEADADHLHEALQRQYVTEDRRLRASKLNALAELAAGAGHEINNPLAVISGQAQYLLHHEPEPARHRALQTIIAQAHRIHLILSELMQFARPPRPQKQWIDAANVTDHVAGQLQELANERQVQVERFSTGQAVPVYADERQLETALRCLMRNGIEAAPPGGWVRVHLKMATAEQVEWIVEDSGPGPLPNHREHLFDPFYSGRQAGRGLGLGLPTAWRLATQHGGDVRFEQAPLGPTRFVMVIPQKADADQPDSCQEAPGPKPENGQSANGSGHGTGEDGTMSLAPGPHGTDSAPATN